MLFKLWLAQNITGSHRLEKNVKIGKILIFLKIFSFFKKYKLAQNRTTLYTI